MFLVFFKSFRGNIKRRPDMGALQQAVIQLIIFNYFLLCSHRKPKYFNYYMFSRFTDPYKMSEEEPP